MSSEQESPVLQEPIPLHQWTHTGDKVLILRCDNHDLKSHGGFQWPSSGRVEAPDWDPRPKCGNGLHGWMWGLSVGDGKEPDYAKRWTVFAAEGEVIDLGGKGKTRAAEVVYSGNYWTAMGLVIEGQRAWIAQRACSASSLTGDRAASSLTGDRAASSLTGDRAASSLTGDRAASSLTGYGAASSLTGYGAASSLTGDRAASSLTGYGAASSLTGDRAALACTGECCTLEISSTGLVAVTAIEFWWRVRVGAVVAQRVGNDVWLLKQRDLNIPEGTMVRVVHGEVVESIPFEEVRSCPSQD